MRLKNDTFFLGSWVVFLVGMGSVIGFLSHSGVNKWYKALYSSSLTPPHFVFPIVWTILYALLGIIGFMLWFTGSLKYSRLAKVLYILQLLLNWSWPFLFFRYHLIGFSLLVLTLIDFLVALLMYVTYAKNTWVSLLLIPYVAWILFATYLNAFLWHYN